MNGVGLVIVRSCQTWDPLENASPPCSREYSLHWDTLKKILEHAEPPGYRQAIARARPTIEPFLETVHDILESDKGALRKQRHTAIRIFERLRDEHGYTGGYTTVKAVVRACRVYHQHSSEFCS